MGDYRKIRKRIAVSFMAVMMMGILTACSLQKGNESDASLDANGQTGGVIFSKTSGVYGEAFDLQLDGVTEGTVYYTLDGSDPRTSDSRIKYEGKISITDRKGDPNVVSAVDPGLYDTAYAAINPEKDGFMSRVQAPSDEEVDKCTVVKAAVVRKDGSASEVTTHTYFVGSMADHIQGLEESCAAAGMDLAVISISMEYDDLFDSTTGIYVKGDIYDQAIAAHLAEGGRLRSSEARDFDANYKQRGREWERTAHIDFFECNTDDSTCVLSQDCGIRVQGNYSRSDLQKGFRLFARTEYGNNNFDYAVFGNDNLTSTGEVLDKFDTLVLRNGGNCAFIAKYNDMFWQELVTELDCDTQNSRPCVVYLNGEYWGLYILQEDYSGDLFEDTYGVVKEDVVIYKGDAESIAIGYKLDEGEIPAGEEVDYYFRELLDFFKAHPDVNLNNEEDWAAFCEIVDVESVRDYFAVELWINNKWDWPGKNWSMWKTITRDESNEYGDGRWRFSFYDIEFGGIMGAGEAGTNTVKEDNYQPDGMLDSGTENPAVLCFVYAMSNEGFRADFISMLESLGSTYFEYNTAMEILDKLNNTYSPLFDQFFARYDNVGSTDNAVNGGYGSYKCVKEFLAERGKHIYKMVDYINKHYE